jgi:acetyl esterase/lipase
LGSPAAAGARETIPLWPGGAPGAKGDEAKDVPTLSIRLPEASQAVGAAVVVFPGGGYAGHAMDHEGGQIAEWLASRGVAAFVCRYRLGADYPHPAPLTDAQRAVRYVRAHAEEFSVRPERIGIWGFSAGGHLASTLSTHFDDGDPNSEDAVERVGCRPDFAILCYPVVSMKDSLAHEGSRRNLLGENPDPELVESLSNEGQVTSRTPPTFLFHTDEDRAVRPEHSVLYYQALRRAGVPAELHIYERGAHGVGLGGDDPILATWPERLHDWLTNRGVLPSRKSAGGG